MTETPCVSCGELMMPVTFDEVGLRNLNARLEHIERHNLLRIADSRTDRIDYPEGTIAELKTRLRRKVRDWGVEGKCWVWEGKLKADGSAVLSFRGKTYTVTKASWICVNADPGPDLMIVNLGLAECEGTLCCNPAHHKLKPKPTGFGRGPDEAKAKERRIAKAREIEAEFARASSSSSSPEPVVPVGVQGLDPDVDIHKILPW